MKKLTAADKLDTALRKAGSVLEGDSSTVFSVAMPARDMWQAHIKAHAPGCGGPTRVAGTNGGWAACGATVTWFDGKKETVFCPTCQNDIDASKAHDMMYFIAVIRETYGQFEFECKCLISSPNKESDKAFNARLEKNEKEFRGCADTCVEVRNVSEIPYADYLILKKYLYELHA